jgi:ubiquinone/menaquinone biosynthesis C-methylase UbiE
VNVPKQSKASFTFFPACDALFAPSLFSNGAERTGKNIARGKLRSLFPKQTWREHDTVLDVGCGGGRTVNKLAAIATQGKVYGVDYSKEKGSHERRLSTSVNARRAERS